MINIIQHIYPNELGTKIANEQSNRIKFTIKEPYNLIQSVVDVEFGTELDTYKKLLNEWVDGFNDNDLILFIHTKGATRNNKIKREWREYLERELIDNYQYHTTVLNRGFDTSGVLMGIPHWSEGFYPGNFWWANAKFIKRINKNIIDTFPSRWHAELNFLSSIKDWNPHSNPFLNFDKTKNFYYYIKNQDLLKEKYIRIF